MASFANEAENTRSRPVDISNWKFHGRHMGRTSYLVGPVVGAVTEAHARVLVEVHGPHEVTMRAFMDEEIVCEVTKQVPGKTPTAFQLNGFTHGKRIRVVVDVEGEEREARFKTPSNKLDWKIATVSCNCHTHTEELGLWNRLSRVAGDVDCVLHLGDQIYGDSDFGLKRSGKPFKSAWHSCLTILSDLDKSEWDSRTNELLECYRHTYRITWNMPYTAKVLASAANYMICDDHEFTDDLGDEPEHRDPESVEFFVARLAYQVYNEYQKQLLMEIDVTDVTQKPYYAYKLSPRVGFFMTDNRVERSLHRTEGTDEEWTDKTFLGPAQWARMTEAFESDFADCDMILFGAPTPLVFISQKATWLAQKQIDDARGTWGHSDFKNEQEALVNMITDWQNAKFNRAVVTLGGDVHMGGFTDSWHKGSDIAIHQMTASAVGNTPEGNIDAAKELVIRTAMHADQALFPFTVRHNEWIYGPNFGMVDFHLAKHGRRRPATTLTLVPHVGRPRLRNIELGNSDVKVKNREQSEASESAHVFAEIMGVFPDDDEGVAQPGKKSIATKVVHKVTKVTSKAKTDTREKFG